ncbi:MAG: CRTAC1 family protein [Gammaproteobacteria bacterium]|jgi:hypothetical protein|nr:CRTAC1 family protein [Gammaproteobacteria bacterium]
MRHSTPQAAQAIDLNPLRVAGLLLLLAAAALNRHALAWLLTPDPVLYTGTPAIIGVLVQLGLAATGALLLLRPALAPVAAAGQGLVLKLAASAALVGVTATLGMLAAPEADTRYFSAPEYACITGQTYCNRTNAAGLGALARYGKGAAFVDINGDGHIDMYLADADPRVAVAAYSPPFYLGDGSGRFRSVDLGIAADDLVANWSGSFADFDNDGDPDLVLLGGGYAGEGRFALYENRLSEQGRFINITAAAGLAGLAGRPQRWWSSAWADYDGDGWLDLAVARIAGAVLLLHNNGDGTFSDVTGPVGLDTSDSWERDGKNVVWFDFDNDGDPDLYLAGIGAHNLFENLEGKFLLDVTARMLADFKPDIRVYSAGAPVAFAAAAADFDQDGWEDLYLGRQVEQDVLLRNEQGTGFSVQGADIGLNLALNAKNVRRGVFENTMGLGVGDLFDDGWPDLVLGTGDPERAAVDVVLCNRGGQFERCTDLLRGGAAAEHRSRTHGVAFADINADGHTDLVQNLGGHQPWDAMTGIDSRERPALYIASDSIGGNTATLWLEGTRSNRDAVGARVKVLATDTHHYTVRSMQGFQSQNANALVISLGDATVAAVDIRWPSGLHEQVEVTAGSRRRIREGEATELSAR